MYVHFILCAAIMLHMCPILVDIAEISMPNMI